MQAMENKVSAW